MRRSHLVSVPLAFAFAVGLAAAGVGCAGRDSACKGSNRPAMDCQREWAMEADPVMARLDALRISKAGLAGDGTVESMEKIQALLASKGEGLMDACDLYARCQISSDAMAAATKDAGWPLKTVRDRLESLEDAAEQATADGPESEGQTRFESLVTELREEVVGG